HVNGPELVFRRLAHAFDRGEVSAICGNSDGSPATRSNNLHRHADRTCIPAVHDNVYAISGEQTTGRRTNASRTTGDDGRLTFQVGVTWIQHRYHSLSARCCCRSVRALTIPLIPS